MKNTRVLICGAGIAGTALANRLLRHGFEPTLIESASVFREAGYMIDIWGTGYDTLGRYGLLDAARQRGYNFDRIEFVDANGRRVAGFGGTVLRRSLHGKFFSILRGDLARVIYDTIATQVETLFGTSIRALHDNADGVDVELSTGEMRHFDLVIGTDGLHSRVRELAFGAEALFEKYLGYAAASFVADHYPHRNEGAYVSFAQPGRQLSRYAMRGERSAFLFVFAENDRTAIPAHHREAQRTLLHARFGNDGWESADILARLDFANELYLDAVSQVRMPRWSKGRVALVGDAAYSPSLLAGAGAAFALLGAYVLGEELSAADADYLRAFARYEQQLQPFLRRQQDDAVSFAAAFAPRTAFGLFVRNAVLNLMNIPAFGLLVAHRIAGETFPLA